MMRGLILAGIIVALALQPAVRADEVLFKNGDRLTGKVLDLVEGKLTIESQIAGKVTVNMADVATLSTAGPVALHLSDESVVQQTLSAGEPGTVGIAEGGVLQAQVFSIEDIVAINPPPAEDRPKWNGSITAGYLLTTGNTETESRSLDLALTRRGEQDRLTLGGNYYYGKQEDPSTGQDNVTQNEWSAGGKYDYFLTEKVYGYGSGRFQHDEVALLDRRTTVGTGLGYQWVERDDLSFATEAGVGFLHEEYADVAQTTNNQATAQAGYHLMKKLNSEVTFLHDLTYQPAWRDLADYYLTTSAQLRLSITEPIFFSLKVALDYDATPAEGRKKADTKYIVGVGANF